MQQEYSCYKAGISISPGSRALQPSFQASASEVVTFQAGASLFLWQSTVATREAMMPSCYSIQESEILGPKLFYRTIPSSSLPSTVLSPPSQAHLLSYPWLFPFFLHSNTASTGGQEKKAVVKQIPCDVQSPLWLLQSLQQCIPIKVYGAEVQVMACQLHCGSFLCAYHRFTLWKMR